MRPRWFRMLPLAALLALAVPAPAAAEPVDVHVGLYLLNFGNFDVTKGTYVADFYLWFNWSAAQAPPGFSPEKFELMNGRAASRERILDQANADGTREVWFRIQANLYADPQFANYPFDNQTLPILLEDSNSTVEDLVYVPLTDGTGLDPAVKVAGYRLTDFTSRVADKTYPFGGTYSRAAFVLSVHREALGTAVKTFLPPFVFMLVSGLSFLFPPEKLALRIGAGTSMLISAVMYHIAQTASLPPLGTLTLMDKIMMSTYAFLALSLAITASVSVNADYLKRPDLFRWLSRTGAALTIAAPVVVFVLLTYL